MRLILLVMSLSLGALGLYLEFRTIKQADILFTEYIVQFPLLLLCILTVFSLFKDKAHYAQSQKISAYLTSFVSVCFVAVIVSHIYVRYQNDKSKTWFIASNYSINKEGIILNFKDNNHLKGIQVQKFGETHYWGSFERVGDTIQLNLKTDFPLATKAYIVKDSLMKTDQLHFKNDHTFFQIWYEPDTAILIIE